MSRRLQIGFLCLWVFLPGAVSRGADPPGSKGSPFTAELEVYSGGITGDSVGAAFKSATRGSYGARFTLGFTRFLNFSFDYLYSNQSRSFTAVTPETATLPQGTLLMRANNLNVFFGSGEFNLIRTDRAKFYISPGIGVARNGSRNLTLITPLGAASAPLLGGRAVTFNLGAGVKIYPWKRVGFRLDVRDHVSGGATGSLAPPDIVCPAVFPPDPECLGNAPAFFGKTPVQNNVVFTLGLIFRLL